MKKQFYSISNQEKYYQIRYPVFEKKQENIKVSPQQMYKNGNIIGTGHKKSYDFPIKKYDFLSEASKSETFIQPPTKMSLSRLQKDEVSLSGKKSQGKRDEDKYLQPRCDKSLQLLVGPKVNAYKTQYSKIARRKQTIIKRNLIEVNGRQDKGRFEEFSQSKLIEKYRELILQNQPLNFVNKLYQNDILSTKLMPISTKSKLALTKFQKNDKEIEQKICNIVSRPSEYDAIRKMLLNIHDRTEDYPYIKHPQEKQLANHEKQLIQQPKFIPISRIAVQPKRLATTNQSLKNTNIIKEETHSLPRKIESESHIDMNTLKQVSPPPKKVSSSAFIVYEVTNTLKQRALKKISIEFSKKKEYQNNIHASFNIKVASEIASLTKIMTCLIVIEICQKYKIDPKTQKYKTGAFQSFIHGTSADIEPGQIYTIHQLLHGLMLPSGNDASLALARWGGNILILNDLEKRTLIKLQVNKKMELYEWAEKNKFIKSSEERLRAKRCYNRFIAQMNKKGRILMLERTSYANSHGLSNSLNKSCCLDLALLCQYAMNNPYFKSIVSCKSFKDQIDKQICVQEGRSTKKRTYSNFDPQELNLQADAEDQQGEEKSDQEREQMREEKHIQYTTKSIEWMNTHKLLHEKDQYIGIKTGVTVTAGPCLASYLQIKQRKFIIIVLNSKRLIQRFIDTQILKAWLIKKQKLKNESKLSILPSPRKFNIQQSP